MQFSDIPSDTLTVILQNLDPKEICRFGQISRACYEAATDANLWRRVANDISLVLKDGENVKSQVVQRLRCVEWSSMHNSGVRLETGNLTAITDNGNWNGCVGDPIMRSGVHVWGVKVSRGAKQADRITFQLGIVDETLKPTSAFTEYAMEGWYKGHKGGHYYCTNESWYEQPTSRLDSPEYYEEKMVPVPNFYACRLVLVKGRRSFEMWDITGWHYRWDNLPAKLGFCIAFGLSGEETQAEILPHVHQLEDIPKILPQFDVNAWKI